MRVSEPPQHQFARYGHLHLYPRVSDRRHAPARVTAQFPRYRLSATPNCPVMAASRRATLQRVEGSMGSPEWVVQCSHPGERSEPTDLPPGVRGGCDKGRPALAPWQHLLDYGRVMDVMEATTEGASVGEQHVNESPTQISRFFGAGSGPCGEVGRCDLATGVQTFDDEADRGRRRERGYANVRNEVVNSRIALLGAGPGSCRCSGAGDGGHQGVR